jgi:hypothetical protein
MNELTSLSKKQPSPLLFILKFLDRGILLEVLRYTHSIKHIKEEGSMQLVRGVMQQCIIIYEFKVKPLLTSPFSVETVFVGKLEQ